MFSLSAAYKEVMTRRALILVPALLSLALPAASVGSSTAKSSRLQSFGSCGQLLGYVKQQALPIVQPWGLGASYSKGALPPSRATVPSAAATADGGTSATPEYSTTNVQEEGVDEPDIVKSNGSTIFVLNQNTIRAVDVRGTKPRLVGSLELTSGFGSELLLYGNHLLVLSRGGTFIEPLPAVARMIAPIRPSQSVLTDVDVTDPSAMKVLRTMTLDGSSYLSARLISSTVRVVVSSAMPYRLEFPTPSPGTPQSSADSIAKNRATVSSSGVSSWLPRYTVQRRGAKSTSRSLVQCRNVMRPPSFSGLGLLTVLTIDLSKGLDPVDSDAIVTDGRIVYASPNSLYVATESWADRPLPATPNEAPPNVTTEIHKFDISEPTQTEFRGSGEVPGYLLSQWSLSEYGGNLRVASTEAPAWWGGNPALENTSSVSVLQEQGGKLATIGSVGDLGRGERIYAVRFIGDTGYVVTFRQVDPLYTLDLSNPQHPAVLGELQIQGYSSYLHPVGDNLLLGVGQDASAEGRLLGSELSLFDVSNLRKPVRLFQKALGPGNSEAEYDHHAFLYWPKTGLVAVPVQTYSTDPAVPQTPFVGAIGFRVSRQRGIEELGRISHTNPAANNNVAIRRSLVVGDTLYTVSDLGVQANNMATFSLAGWAGFPQPEPQPIPVPSPGPVPVPGIGRGGVGTAVS
jgi:hypothetical protein